MGKAAGEHSGKWKGGEPAPRVITPMAARAAFFSQHAVYSEATHFSTNFALKMAIGGDALRGDSADVDTKI